MPSSPPPEPTLREPVDDASLRELAGILAKVPHGVYSRGHSHDDRLPIGVWVHRASAGLLALLDECARLRARLDAAEQQTAERKATAAGEP